MQKDDVKIDVFTDEQIKQMLNFYRRIKQREKKVAAIHAIVDLITTEELKANYVIPDPFDPRLAAQVAAAVTKSAIETKVGQKVVHPD